jgi:cupin 2 domain-containing protein
MPHEFGQSRNRECQISEAPDNLFACVPVTLAEEQVIELVSAPGLRVERIVSTGQASPPGFWYDQDWAEWVLILSGSAGLQIEGEAEPRLLLPGSHLHLPRHCRHRVAWTSAEPATVWLAVHYRD